MVFELLGEERLQGTGGAAAADTAAEEETARLCCLDKLLICFLMSTSSCRTDRCEKDIAQRPCK